MELPSRPAHAPRLVKFWFLWILTDSINRKTYHYCWKNIWKVMTWLSGRGRKDRMPIRNEPWQTMFSAGLRAGWSITPFQT